MSSHLSDSNRKLIKTVSKLDKLISNGDKIDQCIFNSAVEIGDIRLIDYLLSIVDSDITSDACLCAVRKGDLHLLKHLRGKELHWDHKVFAAACYGCDILILEYLFENKCPCKDIKCCAEVARKGNIQILKSLRQRGFDWDTTACSKAALSGNIDMIIFLRDNGCPWNEKCFSNAAFGGHIELLRYLHDAKCPMNANAYDYAKSCGHTECAEFLKDM